MHTELPNKLHEILRQIHVIGVVAKYTRLFSFQAIGNERCTYEDAVVELSPSIKLQARLLSDEEYAKSVAKMNCDPKMRRGAVHCALVGISGHVHLRPSVTD